MLKAQAATDGEAEAVLSSMLQEFAPIAILLVVVTFVLARLPKIHVGHGKPFLRRRVLNWLPLGLTYAFLYMGRYNLKVSKFAFEEMRAVDGSALMGNDDFGWIFGIGTYVYGFSFLLNGPLTDRFGGKFSILVGAAGASVANLLMGLGAWTLLNDGPGKDFVAQNSSSPRTSRPSTPRCTRSTCTSRASAPWRSSRSTRPGSTSASGASSARSSAS
jgi:hypothetical protein